ncbi:MAG: type VI secretion system baseplate subunit TssK [Syntrophobacteraceae bacterium]|nr:type VI secretion system baseplate subunit TssK [Syntrophobacteraceae bacterium]
MTAQKPLFWHQGLFLQPHHFQWQDQFVQSLLEPFTTLLAPHFWGVADLEVHLPALGNRTFQVLKAEILFQDGAHVVFPGNAVLDPRSFEEAWVEGGRPLTIYLGLRKWNLSRENVTTVEAIKSVSEINTRFVTEADAEELPDLHETGPQARVGRMVHALRVFWGTEKEEIGDYDLVPVGQLERFGEEIRFSSRYAPPSLSLTASEPLAKIVKEIRDQVTARAHHLEEFKTQRGIHTAEFGSRDMVYLLALRSLNRYVPMLAHLTEVRQAHPWTVYGLLRQLIGELSSFSERVNVLGEMDRTPLLPSYDHLSLWECFAAAQALITQLLDEITAGPDYVIRLVFDGTYYASELAPAIFEGRNRYYLVFRSDTDPKFVLSSLATIIKISSREQLPILIARALPGIVLEHLPVPPQELPRRAHCIYFQIDHHGDHWGLIEKGRNIAMYWDTAPEDLEVELMVVGRG